MGWSLLAMIDNHAEELSKNPRWAMICSMARKMDVSYNCLVLTLAASGMLTPWVAAIGMSLSSLGVVLNAIRIKHSQPV